MIDDELHRPLGQNTRKAAEKAKASHLKRTWMVLGGVLGVVGAGALALAARDPLGWNLGGRPYAVARIEPYKPPPRSRRNKSKTPPPRSSRPRPEAARRAAAIMFSR